jgi:alginate O-acetyltransferase complex protein AlgI
MRVFTASYVLVVMTLLCVYWRLPRKAQNVLLLLAGLGLCASWDVRFSLLLLVTSLVEYGIGLRLSFTAPDHVRTRWMWTAVVLDVATLASFKYLDLLAPELNALASSLSIGLALPAKHILIPLGLSFYTLQRLSHTLDVYYRVSEPCRSLLDYLTFSSFFPLLTSGPIERGKNLLPQLASQRRFAWDDLTRATWLVALGAFKKAFIGDQCALIAKALLPAKSDHVTALGTLIGLYAYAFELYGDFAGYSDIARGTAIAFGIRVMDNFRAPYLSENISEFWQRWHISLSSFLDQYVYRPCALLLRNRGTPGIVLALYVTFVISALWHGRGVTFLAWGAVHATALSLYMLSKKQRKRLKRAVPERILRVASVVLTFHIVIIGYAFFRAHTVHAGVVMLCRRLFDVPFYAHGLLGRALPLGALIGTMLLLDLMPARTRDEVWIFSRPLWFRAVCYAALLMCVLKFWAPAQPFVYLQL